MNNKNYSGSTAYTENEELEKQLLMQKCHRMSITQDLMTAMGEDYMKFALQEEAKVYIKETMPSLFMTNHLKLNNTFENTYVRELSITSHAHEILDLHREVLTACDEKHKKELWEKYRNQCVDLMLVLISEYDSDPERIAARIHKFAEKGKLDDEEK